MIPFPRQDFRSWDCVGKGFGAWKRLESCGGFLEVYEPSELWTALISRLGLPSCWLLHRRPRIQDLGTEAHRNPKSTKSFNLPELFEGVKNACGLGKPAPCNLFSFPKTF